MIARTCLVTIVVALLGCGAGAPVATTPGPEPTSGSGSDGQAAGTVVGVVRFVGLPCPESQPLATPCEGAPLPNYDVVAYAHDGKTEVRQAKTDAAGAYRLELPPGSYAIFTQAGLHRENRRRNDVTIGSGRETTLDLRVDTGVR